MEKSEHPFRQNLTSEILKKPRLIHYGFGKECELLDKVNFCLENDWVLVFITPAVKKFHPKITDAINTLKENIWVYEMNMAMKAVMERRAWDYFCNYSNSYFNKPLDISDYTHEDLLCCYVETNPKPVEEKLFKSASIFGIYPTAIGKGENWEGFVTTRLKLYLNFLETRTEKFVVCTDARDVLYFNSKHHILQKFLDYYKRGHKLVYNAETNCFPNLKLKDIHPCQDKKYKFLNAGCFIGEREFLIETLKKCFEYQKMRKVINKEDDQEILQHIFTDNIKNKDYSIWLDYDCNIFQVLWDENGGRSANFDLIYYKNYIHNIYTHSKPCIIHHPGPTGHGETVWKILTKNF